jgi:hypothetical protein
MEMLTSRQDIISVFLVRMLWKAQKNITHFLLILKFSKERIGKHSLENQTVISMDYCT